MKHIKTYEFINKDEPHFKDYIIGDPNLYHLIDDVTYNDDFVIFINNNAGQIIDKKREFDYCDDKFYINFIVKYKNIPVAIQDAFLTDEDTNDKNILNFRRDHILSWAKTKPELKLKLLANKYNL